MSVFKLMGRRQISWLTLSSSALASLALLIHMTGAELNQSMHIPLYCFDRSNNMLSGSFKRLENKNRFPMSGHGLGPRGNLALEFAINVRGLCARRNVTSHDPTTANILIKK